MSAPKFAIGMVFVITVVAVWSIMDSAPWTTILLRAVICAIVLQVGYVLVVLGMVAKHRKPARKAVAAKPAETDTGKISESNLSR